MVLEKRDKRDPKDIEKLSRFYLIGNGESLEILHREDTIVRCVCLGHSDSNVSDGLRKVKARWVEMSLLK